MGGTNYLKSDYDARLSYRSATARSKGIPLADAIFVHSADIRDGKTTAKVHDSLSPKGVKIRESRDSDVHPVTVPIAVILDTTGSMGTVPGIIQGKLNSLMGCFLDDKASGKKYLGEGYPAILIGAVDDYEAQRHYKHEGTLQVSQWESGIEVDNNLTNLWITQNGGGTYEESYDLGLYFMARHTAHDNWDKRRRKGYVFMIGDEHAYAAGVSKAQVKDIIGDTLQANISLKEIIAEVQERYHLFFIIPNLSSHYHDTSLERYWVNLLGQQNVIKLEDPGKICECIVSAVAIGEEHVGLDELLADGVATGLDGALVPFAKAMGEVSKYDAGELPVIAGAAGETERL